MSYKHEPCTSCYEHSLPYIEFVELTEGMITPAEWKIRRRKLRYLIHLPGTSLKERAHDLIRYYSRIKR